MKSENFRPYSVPPLYSCDQKWRSFIEQHFVKHVSQRWSRRLDRSVSDFGQSVLMTPERPLPVALKEHLRVLLHWCASLASLPCSPPPHRQYYKCRYLASLQVDEVPRGTVEGYPGKRKRHKITQLASHSMRLSAPGFCTAFCHYITPSECSRIFSGTNFAKTAKLHD